MHGKEDPPTPKKRGKKWKEGIFGASSSPIFFLGGGGEEGMMDSFAQMQPRDFSFTHTHHVFPHLPPLLSSCITTRVHSEKKPVLFCQEKKGRDIRHIPSFLPFLPPPLLVWREKEREREKTITFRRRC